MRAPYWSVLILAVYSDYIYFPLYFDMLQGYMYMLIIQDGRHWDKMAAILIQDGGYVCENI
jgi:hypothetical protein